MARIAIVPTTTANIASVQAAIARAGHESAFATAQSLEGEAYLVLPGVGTFGAARRALDDAGLAAPLARRLQSSAPTLAICVGLQLLARASEESPGTRGFGLLDATVRSFPAGVRRPQFGWNCVSCGPTSSWLPDGYAYFANSFAVVDDPGSGWRTAWAEHGVRFVAAAARGRLWACQFHPELSGDYGALLFARWLSESVPC